jgi:hypothetical protein
MITSVQNQVKIECIEQAFDQDARQPIGMGAFRRACIGGTWSDESQMVLVKFDRVLARGVREWPLSKARLDIIAEEHREECWLFIFAMGKTDNRKSKDSRKEQLGEAHITKRTSLAHWKHFDVEQILRNGDEREHGVRRC